MFISNIIVLPKIFHRKIKLKKYSSNFLCIAKSQIKPKISNIISIIIHFDNNLCFKTNFTRDIKFITIRNLVLKP